LLGFSLLRSAPPSPQLLSLPSSPAVNGVLGGLAAAVTGMQTRMMAYITNGRKGKTALVDSARKVNIMKPPFALFSWQFDWLNFGFLLIG